MLTGYVDDFEVMKKVYGPDIVIKKEECINHVNKRLGTALRSTLKDCRAQGISLGGKAHGSLKEATIKKLTTYYQKAILRNKRDVNAMKTAIYTTLLHRISTDAKPQHSKCPAGENSWCFYQSAIANGEKPNNYKLNVGIPINEKFLPKILPIYQRFASNELLERCIRCGTQNANESLHSMIWAKCPKEILVNKRRVKREVTEAVCEYNKGTVRTIVETQKALGVATGGLTKQIATILDCRKQKFRKRRQNANSNCSDTGRAGSDIFSNTLVNDVKISTRNPEHCSVFRSELSAISGALDHALNSYKGSIWILTDSRSSIQYLKNWPNNMDNTDVPSNKAAEKLPGRGCDLSNPSSTVLTNWEIHSLQRTKMNFTLRNPPAHHWYAAKTHGRLSIQEFQGSSDGLGSL
ncbi:uncharacterized protein TNCV_1925061 [Trichonephila clavipes]|nr:uncharacterized protein TNCV_1925061 [Trichonephila clavipes]